MGGRFEDKYDKIIAQQAHEIADLKEKVETLDKTVEILMKTVDLEDR